MPQPGSIPCTLFDHVLWVVKNPDGSLRRARITLGDCLLLFSSQDGLQDWLQRAEADGECDLTSAVFSRSRREFGERARTAAREGVVGALIDPSPVTRQAPFLRFSRGAA